MLCALFLLFCKHPLWPLSRQDPGTKRPVVHPNLVLESQAAGMLTLQNVLSWPQLRARGRCVAKHSQLLCESLCSSLICYSLLDTRKSNDFPSQLVLLHYANNVL